MGARPVKVSQLNNYINRVLGTDPILGNVSVIGEISNLKFHNSGHVFFSLKDESSKVSCFLASGNLQKITTPLEEGLEIIATGYISVYERGGYYSLNIRDIQANGAGQLAQRFEELKRKLEKEGLFAAEHKQELPAFPEKIAVVTSPTGAAVQDITRTIKNKNDYVDILVCPVLVQGPGAPEDIAKAIDFLNASHSDIDIIITGRGGGSIEELWAFNEEIVARSIYHSKIPVISAVGHETDFTIADFVADVRAATPTAAAELAVPDTNQLREYIDSIRKDLSKDLAGAVDIRRKRLTSLDPEAFARGIQSRIAYEQVNAERLMQSMADHLSHRTLSLRDRVAMLGKLLEASNPTSILTRGYSVVYVGNGMIINRVSGLEPGDMLNIKTADGEADAKITDVKGSVNHG
ncbi:MAG: exodeoxyribonuclease VII large subunit [Firmicutes bacterium]|nr:exodeoxyribonuclease VII large subunit [Bacillota bacterium]